uniref:Glycosyltransferase n=1 Tax=candidate division WOR-3 bacterium TaxID=2052148 RepID=A0A7V3NTW8_UNCW3
MVQRVKRINIYTLNTLSVLGGVERVLLTLWSGLSRRGYALDIIMLRTPECTASIVPELATLPVRQLIMPASKRPLSGPQLLRTMLGIVGLGISHLIFKDLIERGVPDFIMVIDGPELVPDLKSACHKAGVKVKVVYWDHGVIPFQFSRHRGLRRKVYYWLKKRISIRSIRAADLCLAPSRYVEGFLRRASVPVTTIYNPLPKYEGSLIGRPSLPLFLFVGRLLDYSKNLSFLLDCLSKLKEENWKLLVVGSGPDEDKLKLRAKRLGISEQIEWRGFRDDPFADIPETTCLLLVSRSEGFSLVIVEAMQRGIPVISSDCGGPSEIIRTGKNGYLFPVDDEKALIALLRKAIQGELAFASPQEIAQSVEDFQEERVIDRLLSSLEVKNY